MKKENKYTKLLNEYKMNFDSQKIKEEIEKIMVKRTENQTLNVYKNIYSCLDITSLNTTDTKEFIFNFVEKNINSKEDIEELPNVAAICVFPSMVETVREALTSNINIASVAGGFPNAQTFIEVKVAETALAVASGASEIDVVMDLGKFLEQNYEELVEELQEIKHTCREAKLKVILETGALQSLDDVYKATLLAIEGGADFVKTSTGKGYPGASLEAVYAICKGIDAFKKKSGSNIGLKVSGGVSDVMDALAYYTLIQNLLGKEYLTNEFFRIGTSSLFEKLEKEILKNN